MVQGTPGGVARAEFFRLVQYYAERDWLVYRAALNRRRFGPVAEEDDERTISVTESGAIRIEPMPRNTRN